MTREERENAIRCLKLWIEKEPYIQTYKTCLEALEQSMPTMVYPQVDGITPTVVAQADGEKTCGNCRNEDTYHCAECENKSDYEQAQADGEYISKACLKEAIHTLYQGLKLTRTEDDVQKCIDDLPSVAIPNKVGHWEYNQYDGNPNIGNWHCSECRNIVSDMPTCMGKPLYEFCPHCGSPMEIER